MSLSGLAHLARLNRLLGRQLSLNGAAELAHAGRSRCKGVTPIANAPWTCLHHRLFASQPPHTILSMPALSPTMSQGNVASWQVSEGAEITAGDILADIETDKATLPWENQDDGFIAKLLKPGGSKDIPVGMPLVVLVEEKEHIADFKDFSPEGSSAGADASEQTEQQAESKGTPEESQPAAPKQTASSKIGPAAHRLMEEHGLNPEDINPTGPQGIILKGDVLEAIASGGQKQKPTPEKQSKSESKAQPKGVGESQSKAPPPKEAKEHSDRQLEASKAGPAKASQPPSAGNAGSRKGKGPQYTDIPNSQIRKIIAQRLLESKQQIPSLYVSATADVDAVSALRQSLKDQGKKVSINDFVIRAAALALKAVPEANARWDVQQEEVKLVDSIDISIAVATDSGLITPIVAQANSKSLTQISTEVKELAGRARDNKLKPNEFQGGSFSISNLGMYGVDKFSAIINPPQACIMAVGGSVKHIVMQNGKPVVKTRMTVTLSADNRVYDGEVAAKFLEEFCNTIANPVKMLS
ncbi:hypothetical protein WJX82_011033 [Trebouxia sp. C0006]